jgi:hypothetical protein
LQRNDRRVEKVSWGDRMRFSDNDHFFTEVSFDDAHCIRFAQALESNTFLQTLAIKFNLSDCISFQGFVALANGFGKSKLKSIQSRV